MIAGRGARPGWCWDDSSGCGVGRYLLFGGTFIWKASHDQRPYSLSSVPFAVMNVVGNRGPGGAPRNKARTNELDWGENVGVHLDLPVGGCEGGAVDITYGDRTPGAAAPSFHAERGFCAQGGCRDGAGR